MTYEIDIAGLKRQLPLCKVTDDLYIGAFVMFGDVELTVHCARELLARAPEYDYIIAPEAKAIPLAYEMARQSGKPYIVARKGAKLYMRDIVTVHVKSITTSHVQMLCLGKDECDELRGKKILIVDDVISTGDSIKALEQLLQLFPVQRIILHDRRPDHLAPPSENEKALALRTFQIFPEPVYFTTYPPFCTKNPRFPLKFLTQMRGSPAGMLLYTVLFFC